MTCSPWRPRRRSTRAIPGAAPETARGNRALTEAYEPGSTGKVITAAALIEEGAVTPATPITVPNRLRRAGKTFKDFENHKTQKLTYAGTLAKSSNIGTILAAEKMGLEKLYPYLRRFGIGAPTGLGLPGEARGRCCRPSQWSATTGYTSAFGQGYSVNSVQMASVFATIANDGVRVAPRLVAAGATTTGSMQPTPSGKRTRVVSADTAQHGAADARDGARRGRHRPAGARPRLPGRRARPAPRSASTPTAAATAATPCRSSGWRPLDKPRLVVAVTLQAPKSGAGGGSTGGPVFKEVMSFALQSLRIPPTGTKAPGLRIERN